MGRTSPCFAAMVVWQLLTHSAQANGAPMNTPTLDGVAGMGITDNVFVVLTLMIAVSAATFLLSLCTSCPRTGGNLRGGLRTDSRSTMVGNMTYNETLSPPGGNEKMLASMSAIPEGMNANDLNNALKTPSTSERAAPESEQAKLFELKGDIKVLEKLVGNKTSGEMFDELQVLRKRLQDTYNGVVDGDDDDKPTMGDLHDISEQDETSPAKSDTSERSNADDERRRGSSDSKKSFQSDGYTEVGEPADLTDKRFSKLPSAEETKKVMFNILDDRKAQAEARKLERQQIKERDAVARLAKATKHIKDYFAKHNPSGLLPEDLGKKAQEYAAFGGGGVSEELGNKYGESLDEFVARAGITEENESSGRDRANSMYGFEEENESRDRLESVSGFSRVRADTAESVSGFGGRDRSDSIVSGFGADFDNDEGAGRNRTDSMVSGFGPGFDNDDEDGASNPMYDSVAPPPVSDYDNAEDDEYQTVDAVSIIENQDMYETAHTESRNAKTVSMYSGFGNTDEFDDVEDVLQPRKLDFNEEIWFTTYSRDKASGRLNRAPPGTFYVRPSTSASSGYVISCVSDAGRVLHFTINKDPDTDELSVKGSSDVFVDLGHLIESACMEAVGALPTLDMPGGTESFQQRYPLVYGPPIRKPGSSKGLVIEEDEDDLYGDPSFAASKPVPSLLPEEPEALYINAQRPAEYGTDAVQSETSEIVESHFENANAQYENIDGGDWKAKVIADKKAKEQAARAAAEQAAIDEELAKQTEEKAKTDEAAQAQAEIDNQMAEVVRRKKRAMEMARRSVLLAVEQEQEREEAERKRMSEIQSDDFTSTQPFFEENDERAGEGGDSEAPRLGKRRGSVKNMAIAMQDVYSTSPAGAVNEEFDGFDELPESPRPKSFLEKIGANTSMPSMFGDGLAAQLSAGRNGLNSVASDRQQSIEKPPSQGIDFLSELSKRVATQSNDHNSIEEILKERRRSSLSATKDEQNELLQKLRKRQSTSSVGSTGSDSSTGKKKTPPKVKPKPRSASPLIATGGALADQMFQNTQFTKEFESSRVSTLKARRGKMVLGGSGGGGVDVPSEWLEEL